MKSIFSRKLIAAVAAVASVLGTCAVMPRGFAQDPPAAGPAVTTRRSAIRSLWGGLFASARTTRSRDAAPGVVPTAAPDVTRLASGAPTAAVSLLARLAPIDLVQNQIVHGGDPRRGSVWEAIDAAAAAIRLRTDMLTGVVKIRISGGGVAQACTAVRVRSGDFDGFATAAHCLYAGDAHALVRRHTTVQIGTSYEIPVARARLHPSWTRCADATGGLRPSYLQCAQQAPDLALLPIDGTADAALRVARAWHVCSQVPTSRQWTVYGYGATEPEGMPSARLNAGAIAQYDRTIAGLGELVPAVGRSRVDTAGGDSGGPVVTKDADDRMAFSTPEVCFLVAAHTSAPDPSGAPGQIGVVLMQKLYGLDLAAFQRAS